MRHRKSDRTGRNPGFIGALLIAILAALLLAPISPAAAGSAPAGPEGRMSPLPEEPFVEQMAGSNVITLDAGRSRTIQLSHPIERISVSNPKVAEPVVISPTQLLVNALSPGISSLVMWQEDEPPVVYEINVKLDTQFLRRKMDAIFPGESVQVQESRDSIVLTGPVSGPEIRQKLVDLASDYSPKVIDDMREPEEPRKQVMLKVKFAEVNRSAMTELGAVLHHVDPTNPTGNDRGTSGTGEFAPPGGNLLNDPIGPDLNFGDVINLSYFEKSINLGAFFTALRSRGLFQALAEPTLVTADGQKANFLAGGEFPVPIAQPGANFVSVTIEWKQFGISLEFLPTIRDDETIVMKVKPEVSSLDFNNAVLVSGFRIPSLVVRRLETEVELRSGQAFAVGGLYDRNLFRTRSKIPVLGDIPLLGLLFRSKNLAKNRTELLVIVTPTIVEPLGSETEAPRLEMPELQEWSEIESKKDAVR